MNLLVNGSFETGTFAGWTVVLPAAFTIRTDPPPQEGTFYARVGAATQTGSISQTVTTIVGGIYLLSFWARGVLQNPQVPYSIGDTSYMSPPVTLTPVWTNVTQVFEATSTSTLVLFQTPTVGADVYEIDNITFILLAGPCFSGKSLVYCKNSNTGNISTIMAKNIVAGEHDVYNVNENKFVPVVHSIIASTTTRYMLIKKNLLGPDKPFEDFYVTTGHKIVINGVEKKAKDIEGAIKVKVPAEKIYTICVENRAPILINGLNVMAWGKEEWKNYSTKQNIIWKENK